MLRKPNGTAVQPTLWLAPLRHLLRRSGAPASSTVLVMERDGTLQRASPRLLTTPPLPAMAQSCSNR